MKQIIADIPLEYVTIDLLPRYPIVGLTVRGTKGWLQRTEFESDLYRAFCQSLGVALGNQWGGKDSTKSLKSWFEWGVEDPHTEIKFFLFNNERELFTWLSTDSKL